MGIQSREKQFNMIDLMEENGEENSGTNCVQRENDRSLLVEF